MGKRHLILASMRSGSSVFAHMLADCCDMDYVGEMHCAYPYSEQEFRRVKGDASKEAGEYPLGRGAFLDKIVTPRRYLRKGWEDCVDYLHIHLRDPRTTWASLKSFSAIDANLFHLHSTYKSMLHALQIAEEAGIPVSYSTYPDLFSPEGRASLFGDEFSTKVTYRMTSTTGKAGKGDGKNVGRGEIVPRSLEGDLRDSCGENAVVFRLPIFRAVVRAYEALLEAGGLPPLPSCSQPSLALPSFVCGDGCVLFEGHDVGCIYSLSKHSTTKGRFS